MFIYGIFLLYSLQYICCIYGGYMVHGGNITLWENALWLQKYQYSIQRMLWTVSNSYYLLGQQHTTLHTTTHPTAGLPLKLSRVGPCWSLDGRPEAARSGVGRPIGCILSSDLNKISQCLRAVIEDIALCRVVSSGGTLNECPDSLWSLKLPWCLL
jgi:hypothetical protein